MFRHFIYFKELRKIDANNIFVPKYKELSVSKQWLYINEISELNQYFPNHKKKSFQKRIHADNQ